MSYPTAKIYERARQSDRTAEEAWGDLRQLAEGYDWDAKRMLDV